jgi:hypothetical protein
MDFAFDTITLWQNSLNRIWTKRAKISLENRPIIAILQTFMIHHNTYLSRLPQKSPKMWMTDQSAVWDWSNNHERPKTDLWCSNSQSFQIPPLLGGNDSEAVRTLRSEGVIWPVSENRRTFLQGEEMRCRFLLCDEWDGSMVSKVGYPEKENSKWENKVTERRRLHVN